MNGSKGSLDGFIGWGDEIAIHSRRSHLSEKDMQGKAEAKQKNESKHKKGAAILDNVIDHANKCPEAVQWLSEIPNLGVHI